MQKSKLVTERERDVRTSKKQPPAQTATSKKAIPAKKYGGFNATLRTPEQLKDSASHKQGESEALNSDFDIFTKETSKKYKEDAFDKLSDKLIEFNLKDQQKHRKTHDYRKRKLQFDENTEQQLELALADLPVLYSNTDPQEASHLPERPTHTGHSSHRDSEADIIQRSIEYSQHREWLFGKSPRQPRFDAQDDSIAVGSELFEQAFQLRADKPTTSPKRASINKKRNSVDALNLSPPVPPSHTAEDSIIYQSVTDERDVYHARKSQNSSRL